MIGPSIDTFIDKMGFIGHKNDDGELNDFGDSAQRTFSYELCRPNATEYLKKRMLIEYQEFGTNKTQFVRHWDQSMWCGQPKTMSRDNCKPLLWADCYHGMSLVSDVCLSRFGFMWNYKKIWPKPDDPEKKIPDWMPIWVIFGARIRARRKEVSFLDFIILNILDALDLISTLVLCIKSHFKPNETSSDLNQINELIFKFRTISTPVSILQTILYKHLRCRPTGLPKGINKFKRILKMYYWDPIRHPPMLDVYGDWIDILL